MVQGLNSAVALLVGLLTIIMLVASGTALIRASVAKGTVERLRGERDDLEKRVARLEKDRESDQHEINALQAALRQERQQRETLEEVVTGRKELERLVALVIEHDTKVTEHHKAMRDLLVSQWDRFLTEYRRATRALLSALRRSERNRAEAEDEGEGA